MSLSFPEIIHQVIDETRSLLLTVDNEKTLKFIGAIKNDWSQRRLFFWARGRSFLILRGFAMRLMHSGYEVHIVGEVDCPSIGAGDILIMASGSGSTGSVLLFAEKAKKLGATVVAVIGKAMTPLHQLADMTIEFHPEKIKESVQLSANGGGTRFEHSLMLFFDACVLYTVYDYRDQAYREMMKRHANLE